MAFWRSWASAPCSTSISCCRWRVFLTVLLTLSRWYRDSEMVVWFTSGQSLDPRASARSCCSPRRSSWRSSSLSLFLSPVGRAAPDRIRAPARVPRRGGAHHARAVPRIPARQSRRLRRKHQHARRHDPQHLPALGRRGQGCHDGRARGHLEEAPNGDRFIVLKDGRRYEGKPGTAEYRVVEFEKLGRRIEPAELRNLPTSTKAIPTATLVVAPEPGRARRTVLAALRADIGGRADAARGAARLCEPADGPLVQPVRRGRSCTCSTATASTSSRASSHRESSTSGPGSALPHVIAVGVVVLLFSHQLALFARFRRPANGEAAA